ncbi:WAT1-related protein At5g40230 [Lactuca sativa]|uniref:WAT1-related protein At5g40230 n=1 Tax=Lactuca sativa TaxID=4236 RepID=UPI000CC38019|nr:WAT1-related protein At5g40230 [Lactuca sativa]
MKEYVGMVGAQIAQVLLIIVSKYAIADGMSNYSFIFYSNALASLILLPLSLIFHRSANRPPLTFIVVCGFFTIGLLGFFAQVFGYSGISLSSATLATTLLNLIPGFTFILAILFRMETVDLSITTQAKFIGTVVSIAGAIIMTLYKGPTILSSLLKSEISQNLLVQPSNWVLGGIFLAIDCVFGSMYMIAQAFILKKYPAEMIVMFSYCFVCTILAALASSIVEADLSSFSLKPKIRLMSILYSGIFGSAFQVTVQSWCIKRRGPVFVAMFHPIGIVIATFIGVIFLGDGVYLGSLLGSVIVVIGFYSVMWGKAKEKSTVVNNGGSSKLQNEEAPLLQDVVEEHIT